MNNEPPTWECTLCQVGSSRPLAQTKVSRKANSNQSYLVSSELEQREQDKPRAFTQAQIPGPVPPSQLLLLQYFSPVPGTPILPALPHVGCVTDELDPGSII